MRILQKLKAFLQRNKEIKIDLMLTFWACVADSSVNKSSVSLYVRSICGCCQNSYIFRHVLISLTVCIWSKVSLVTVCHGIRGDWLLHMECYTILKHAFYNIRCTCKCSHALCHIHTIHMHVLVVGVSLLTWW